MNQKSIDRLVGDATQLRRSPVHELIGMAAVLEQISPGHFIRQILLDEVATRPKEEIIDSCFYLADLVTAKTPLQEVLAGNAGADIPMAILVAAIDDRLEAIDKSKQ